MKRIYQAANNIEAHMLVHLLEQEGIEAHVEGEHLQSGAGELSHASRESSTAARSPTVPNWISTQMDTWNAGIGSTSTMSLLKDQ
jgi:hypothetical protein